MSTPEVAVTPQEQSVEERIAAKFGFPGAQAQQEAEAPAAETPEPATEPVSDTAEVEWDGAKYSIPSPLKDAFEKASDYTRKTQELAEQRRTIEHTREVMTHGKMESDFRKSIQAETDELTVIDRYLSQAAKLPWASMSTDQMMRQRIEIDQIRDTRDELLKLVNTKYQEFQTKWSENLSQLRAKSREIAAKSIPSYSEETEKAIKQFAMAEGLSEQETDSVLLDPRSAKILWKASQYDKVKAGTAKAVTQTAKAMRPGAASERMPSDVRAKLEYAKALKGVKTSGEKASLIEERLSASPLFRRK